MIQPQLGLACEISAYWFPGAKVRRRAGPQKRLGRLSRNNDPDFEFHRRACCSAEAASPPEAPRSVAGMESSAAAKSVVPPPADLVGTFPRSFAEVISGDGQSVSRERIRLDETGPFGTRKLRVSVKLAGRKWARLEVWDIAANGAFTQPVWLEQ